MSKPLQPSSPVESAEAKLTEMQDAANDSSFLTDLQEVAADFSCVNAEIENYWADASIDKIHVQIMQWKKR